MRIDLHTHSRHSDGTERPADVVRAAAAAGLDVVALTDHDVATGWAEAGAAAADVGITVVPGIEVSTSRAGTSIHLLGYLLDPTHPGLAGALRRAREHRTGRIEQMADLLEQAGYPVSFAGVVKRAGTGATLGRPHLADALVAAGCFADRAEAFATVLHRRSPFYVAHWAPDPVSAVELVLAAGGVPVMAHPFAAERGALAGDEVIAEMVDAGLAGLEVDHRDHLPAAVEHGADLCHRFGLLRTGASDYHGAGKPNRLGERTTDPAALHAVLERGSGSTVLGRPV